MGSADERHQDDQPPDLGAAGAAMREEWRAEQDSATRDAAEQWQHSRTLLDLAREHMHRGDRVAITVAGHRAVGEIIEVARDRIALLGDSAGADSAGADSAGADSAAAAGRRVDVHVTEAVPLAFSVVERARAGGRSGARSATFRARLLELETAGAPIVVATSMGPDRLTGIVRVGTDLIVIATPAGAETVIALSSVAFVSPAA